MVNLEDELAVNYLAECQEQVIHIEEDLLALEDERAQAVLESVNRAFRALHWVRGAAGLFDLEKIGELARQMEDVLGLLRSRKLVPTKARVDVLLDANHCLRDLIQHPGSSNQADIAEALGALAIHDANRRGIPAQWNQLQRAPRRPRVLLVEDDVDSRSLLQTYLSGYAECHVAGNGREAVEAFRGALGRQQGYDLICMDIMMPEMDGREAVRQIRALEEEQEILSTSGVKILMTTAVDDMEEMIRCFHELCDSYLTKPVDMDKLLAQMRVFHLIQ